MLERISPKLAANVMLVGLGALAAFHVLVIVGVLPESMVWAGRGADPSTNVVALEVVALVVTLVLALIVALKVGIFKVPRLQGVLRVLMFLTCAYFLLNTVLNLLSTSSLEKLIFTPLSLILALCALRLALDK